MAYKHPRPGFKLSKQERVDLLRHYYAFCAELARKDPAMLNRKVPREVFSGLHERLGMLLLEETQKLISQQGPVRDFLDANPLPQRLQPHLPDDYRVFCLVLNSLKQWVVSELAMTDRYLLGANARQECREATDRCIISGQEFSGQEAELHHPVRDGRPPILLAKTAHSTLEGQSRTTDEDPVGAKLREARRRLNRSWVFIRLGCDALAGQTPDTAPQAAAAKSTVRRICRETGLTPKKIGEWIGQNVGNLTSSEDPASGMVTPRGAFGAINEKA